MSLAVLKSRALAGMAAPEVTVEVHLGRGLPSFAIVGSRWFRLSGDIGWTAFWFWSLGISGT